ncbi:MAG: hypothetical protein A3B30_03785 [Candidatus Komeilibacteria bacterium RIFCSPLOWO2_01_FULL_52_15]|uniref:DUF3467 domain-containing protein n=2 Tax=Candidatus Komeiliibacteriota TaxID=1817908 RepID=A0A1G2BR67_9BACT|nr:MAG: hypothetical protein A2677_03745 [Candidatus Komeilibacteria bacterium RIFCSPHIGHO2_01_FULL_52_14]OGY91568.1 MAG: hypothetical protein A3B30_03785 [Candidatus Komeilibacteria bacterium RIFCSPLOWO2_01_FULL_52_15]
MAEEKREIQIRIPDDVLKGRYANIVRIDTTREEFIMDFGVINPQQGTGIVTERIIMNPAHVKRMIEVLNRVMQGYEKSHGTVAPAEQQKEIGFTTA